MKELLAVLAPARRFVACAVGVALLGCASAVAGCTAGDRSARTARPTTVAVGVLAQMTGPDSIEGHEAVQGAELAVEIVNDVYPDLSLPLARQAGVAGGIKLALAAADTTELAPGVTTLAEQRAADLVQNRHAIGVIGVGSAAEIAAESQQTEHFQVPFIDASSSAQYLTDFGLDWYFRTGPDDRHLVQALVALLHAEHGLAKGRRIGVLEGAPELTADVATTLAEMARADGFDIGEVVAMEPGRSGAELADKTLAGRPDAVVAIVTNHQEAEKAGAAAQRMRGSTPMIVLGHGLAALSDDSADRGILRTSAWSTDFARRNPAAQGVAQAYERRFGEKMTEAAANAFTAVLTLAMAIDAAGVPDPARVRGALRQIQLPGTQTIMPWGGIRFDSNGQNVLAAGVVEQRGASGFQVVYPRELASADVAWSGAGR
jgi:branched-chain amino acid transport system substrate-binding protein